jgi:transmembrane sensor
MGRRPKVAGLSSHAGTMSKTNSRSLALQTIDDAITWHVRINAGDVGEATWTEFTVWLQADDANRIALDCIEDLDREVTRLLPATSSMAAHAGSIAKSEIWKQVLQRFRPSRSVWAASAAALAASILLAVVFATSNNEQIEYVTHIGETKSVTLADGTRLDMNTATRIFVVNDGLGRHVLLEEGEAFFHVAKDSVHPFRVTVGDRDVSDVGTAFDLLRNEGVITVVVAEGKVAVSPRDDVKRVDELRLAQGDQLIRNEDNGATTVEHVEIARALAWRQGYLIYDKAPLSKVVSDLNRYFPSHISIENNDVASDRFSGALRVDNEDAVLHRLSQFLAVRAQHQADGSIVLRRPRNSD